AAVDGVFGEAAVGAEAVRPMPLRAKAVIQTRGVHPLATTLAAAAPGMNLDRDPIADLKLVDRRTEFHDRSHVFVPRREAAVERQAALDHRPHAQPADGGFLLSFHVLSSLHAAPRVSRVVAAGAFN